MQWDDLTSEILCLPLSFFLSLYYLEMSCFLGCTHNLASRHLILVKLHYLPWFLDTMNVVEDTLCIQNSKPFFETSHINVKTLISLINVYELIDCLIFTPWCIINIYVFLQMNATRYLKELIFFSCSCNTYWSYNSMWL